MLYTSEKLASLRQAELLREAEMLRLGRAAAAATQTNPRRPSGRQRLAFNER